MDFSRVELSDEDKAFLEEARSFLATHMTDEVRRRDRETGDNFDEGLHLAFGAAGYLELEWKPHSEGGFSRVRRRIWELEKRRAHVPWVTWGTTAMVARSVVKFGSPELQDEVMPGVFSGEVRLCLATPSPKAAPTSRPARPARCATVISWIINGSKMFTTGAHNCQYVFLITNTAPDALKHKSLTMFLVPLDSPGIEIQGIRTVDGDRTNIVYYSDVRVDDKYRLGEVNAGWTVLREPLNAEHGAVAAAPDGLQDTSIMMHQAGSMSAAVDKAAARVAQPDPTGRRLIDDKSVAYRLGRSVARLEAALLGPEHLRPGRDRADDARHLAGSDGHARRGISAAVRDRRGRRRRQRRVRIPLRSAGGNLRRHARGVPQHDRPVHAWAGQAQLLAAAEKDVLSRIGALSEPGSASPPNRAPASLCRGNTPGGYLIASE